MAAILTAIIGIGTVITALFAYCMYMVDGTVDMVTTAFTVIEALPTYMVFLPSGCIAIMGSAFGIHILRTVFGR